MADRKTSGAGEKGKAPPEPTYTATQLRAFMGNTKPEAASHVRTARLSESDVDTKKIHVSGDATLRARRLVNLVPRKSRERAFDAFRTFSLSRFPLNNVPHNYLTGDSAKDPAAIAETQKRLIENGLANAKDLDTDNAGMT